MTIPDADAGKDWKPSATTTTPAYGQLNLVEATAKLVEHRTSPSWSMDVGPENVVSLGQPDGRRRPSSSPTPSLVLGTEPVSVLDMASGYSTFVDNGEHVEPGRRHPGHRRQRPRALRGARPSASGS